MSNKQFNLNQNKIKIMYLVLPPKAKHNLTFSLFDPIKVNYNQGYNRGYTEVEVVLKKAENTQADRTQLK